MRCFCAARADAAKRAASLPSNHTTTQLQMWFPPGRQKKHNAHLRRQQLHHILCSSPMNTRIRCITLTFSADFYAVRPPQFELSAVMSVNSPLGLIPKLLPLLTQLGLMPTISSRCQRHHLICHLSLRPLANGVNIFPTVRR